MVQGQEEGLKNGGGELAFFLFNYFKVYHFCICKLPYLLQNCVMSLKKK